MNAVEQVAEMIRTLAPADGNGLVGGHGVLTLSNSHPISIGDLETPLPGPFYRIDARIDDHAVKAFLPKEKADALLSRQPGPARFLLAAAHAFAPVRKLLLADGIVKSVKMEAVETVPTLPLAPAGLISSEHVDLPVVVQGEADFGAWLRETIDLDEEGQSAAPAFDISYRAVIVLLRSGPRPDRAEGVHLGPGSALRLHGKGGKAMIVLGERFALGIESSSSGQWTMRDLAPLPDGVSQGMTVVEAGRGTVSSTLLEELEPGQPVGHLFPLRDWVTLMANGEEVGCGRVLDIAGARVLVLDLASVDPL